MVKNRINRRQFLVGTLGTLGAGILASCAPEVVRETVIVKETVEVEVETEVERIVEQTVEVETLVDAAPQLEGRTAVLWGLQYEPHVGAYDRLAALFLGQTGATVAVEPQDWPIETKLISALAAGTQPDIACIMGKMLLPLQLQDALLPLMDLVYNHNGVDPSTAFVGDGIGCYTWGGDIWGVPTENNNCGSMVNVLVDEVEALGLADTYPPTNGENFFESYEAMWDLAAELQIEEDGRVSRWGLTSKGWEDTSLMGIMRSLGADDGMEWWDLDNRKFNFDTEIGIEAMRLLVEEPVKLGIETNLDQGSVDTALAGKVALSRGNLSPSLQGAEMGYAYRLAGVPKLDGKDPLFVGEGGWGFLAPYESENQDVAIDFLRMVCTTAGQKEFARIYSGIHTPWVELQNVYDHFEDSSPDSATVLAAELMNNVLSPRTQYYGEQFGYIGEISAGITEAIDELRQLNITSAEAAALTQQRAEEQYEQFLLDLEDL